MALTFDEAVGQLHLAVRRHGAALRDLLERLNVWPISKEQFVTEIAALHQAFEKTVEDLTHEAKSTGGARLAEGA